MDQIFKCEKQVINTQKKIGKVSLFNFIVRNTFLNMMKPQKQLKKKLSKFCLEN